MLTLHVHVYRSAPQNDRAASCARVLVPRRIAFMNLRGGSYLLPTLRAFHEGIPRHLSAVARMESLHALMSMIALHAPTIALEMLHIRAIALSDESWILRCARITIQSLRIKGTPLRVGMLLLVNLNKMGKHFSSYEPGSPFNLWRLMGRNLA